MAKADIFGNKKKLATSHLLSAQYVGIRAGGGGEVTLGTGAQGQYGRQTQQLPVFGNTTLYYLSSPASGGVEVNAMVGGGGFFHISGGGDNSPCDIRELDIVPAGFEKCNPNTRGFALKDCVLTNVGFGWQAGSTPVTSSASFLIGNLLPG